MHTLASYFHDLSPFVIRLSGDLGLRWYGLSYALGLLLGWMLLRRLSRRGFTPIPPDRITDLVMALVFGVLIGGRLGYVLFYQPSLLWSFTGDAPFWGLLQINRGGMASHGGMAGVILTCIYYVRSMRRTQPQDLPQRPVLHVLDLAALACPIGLGLGRLANFINGELLGRIVAAPGQPAPWWSVKFPKEVITEHAPPLSPEQATRLNEIVAPFARPGDAFEDAYARVLDAVQHGGKALGRSLEPLIAARHPSQLYQATAEGLVLLLVLLAVAATPKRPGVIGAMFLVTYGVLRIITEVWRLPDVGVSTVLGLSRGQQLSAVMVLAGGVALTLVSRGDAPKVGGWLRGGPGGLRNRSPRP